MARCSRCGSETQLYVGESPMCEECDDKQSAAEPRAATETGQRDSSRPVALSLLRLQTLVAPLIRLEFSSEGAC
jgi:hypothetical protein